MKLPILLPFLLLIPLSGCAGPTLGRDGALLIGHRGNSSEAPENTLAAVRSALELDAPCELVEIDVHASADGELVVIHDATIDRTTDGRGKVAELSWEALRARSAGYAEKYGDRFAGERIPSLEEVLDAVADGGAGVMIEIKARGLGDEVARLLASRGELGDHVVASFHAGVVVDVSMADPRIPTLYLGEEATPEQIEVARRIGADVIGIPSEGLSAALIERAHAGGLAVWVWTVNEPERAGELLGWGADGIITDRPRAMRELGGLRR